MSADALKSTRSNNSRRQSLEYSIVTGTGDEEDKGKSSLADNNFEKEKSVRSYFELMLSSTVGRVLDMITTFLCLASFVIYIISTYEIANFDPYFDYIDWVVIFYFLLEFSLRYDRLIRFYVSQNKISFLKTPATLIDIYTTSPLIFLFKFYEKKNNLFYHTTVVARFFRFVKYVHRLFQVGRDEVYRQLLTIILTVMTMIFATAGFVLAIENPARREHKQENL